MSGVIFPNNSGGSTLALVKERMAAEFYVSPEVHKDLGMLT